MHQEKLFFAVFYKALFRSLTFGVRFSLFFLLFLADIAFRAPNVLLLFLPDPWGETAMVKGHIMKKRNRTGILT